ncbi:amino acid transporter, partial [Staphylococcus pseudintermedius]|nr:amino acid transporter [Staphylococcus pseudintermedius]
PLIKGMQYIFPNSYNNVVDLNDFFIKLFFSILITSFYSLLFYILSLRIFNNLEY